jgi:hypothetical protein
VPDENAADICVSESERWEWTEVVARGGVEGMGEGAGGCASAGAERYESTAGLTLTAQLREQQLDVRLCVEGRAGWGGDEHERGRGRKREWRVQACAIPTRVVSPGPRAVAGQTLRTALIQRPRAHQTIVLEQQRAL